MKKYLCMTALLVAVCIGGCAGTHEVKKDDMPLRASEAAKEEPEETTEERSENVAGEEALKSLIIPTGTVLGDRISTPEGYQREEAEQGSLQEFLRNYPMKEEGSPVLLYNGNRKGNQTAHAAVFDLPLENEDLQQCADSVMRVYAEYFWKTGQYERIAFHFVNGFSADYVKWREGSRISVNGNDAAWSRTASYDDSYDNFVQYLRIVFAYAGTLSMDGESEPVDLKDARAGDVFLKAGSPGHVVLIVDMCENGEGEKAFLLAQGYMPAQEFHLLKNPGHEDDPWYYEREVVYPFVTPEYTFDEGSLRRLSY